MNKDVKAQWVKALRSGKYKQTKGVLKNMQGFCCLGVLCDLYDSTKWEEKRNSEAYDFLDETEMPPKIVSQWAGLDAAQTAEPSNKTLYDLNDENDGPNFVEMADIIEKQF